MKQKLFLICVAGLLLIQQYSFSQGNIDSYTLVTSDPLQYEKIEFTLDLIVDFSNPYDAADVALDMIISAPSGQNLSLPCYFSSGDASGSVWKAHFAAAESGIYSYYFRLSESNAPTDSTTADNFNVAPSAKDGFIGVGDFWTFKYSSGKPFRGIGENVGWENRSWENSKYTYDYFLPSLAKSGANFFRTWMHTWNLPLEWKKVASTNRYKNSTEYFNPGAIERMDELIDLCDSLDVYVMLALDAHGGFITTGEWPLNNYNSVNGGPVASPAQFFSSDAAKAKYKNRLRYLVARWGYSTRIGVWEFFNEIDNAMYNGQSIIIPHADVTAWHAEMSAYLKSIDPFNHLVSTSISHREITGLTSVPDMDFNMKHIYNSTSSIPTTIKSYVNSTDKPYVIGEFGYDWDWNNVTQANGPKFDYDYKRGLWYGLFTSTPVLPLTWWWEFFDERNMTPYMSGVREISDKMLEAGKGSFEYITGSATGMQVYAVKCDNMVFAYLLNDGTTDLSDRTLNLTLTSTNTFTVSMYNPDNHSYTPVGEYIANGSSLAVPGISLVSKDERVLILNPVGNIANMNTPFGDTLAIPGSIEAEDFDKGGNDVSYNDFDDVNVPGYYRSDVGVDIDTNNAGGYSINNIVVGEWLEYTFKADTAGTYLVEIGISCSTDNKIMHLEIDRSDVTESIDIPNTGGVWDTIEVEIPLISSGTHILKIVQDESDFNIDFFKFNLTNKAPEVSIQWPSQDTTVHAENLPIEIAITSVAEDMDGSIDKVEYYADNVLIGDAASIPYEYIWNVSSTGTFAIYARAYDTAGLASNSKTIYITVSQSQSPYGGTAAAIPGKIEAENYDNGGEGFAYHDISAGNKFNVYRNDDVDIEACTDAGGGYSLGELEAGEWTAYTVNISSAGTYGVEFRIATQQANTKFHVELNNVNSTGTITVPNTGGWQSWQSVYRNIELPAGEKELKIVIEAGYFNINYLVVGTPSKADVQTNTTPEIYPNPVQNILFIENISQGDKLIIYDITGIQVGSYTLNTGSVDLSELSDGLYMAKLCNSSGEIVSVVRLIKN